MGSKRCMPNFCISFLPDSWGIPKMTCFPMKKVKTDSWGIPPFVEDEVCLESRNGFCYVKLQSDWGWFSHPLINSAYCHTTILSLKSSLTSYLDGSKRCMPNFCNSFLPDSWGIPKMTCFPMKKVKMDSWRIPPFVEDEVCLESRNGFCYVKLQSNRGWF